MFSRETTVASLTAEQVKEIAEKLSLSQCEVVWAMPASSGAVLAWSKRLDEITTFVDAWRIYEQVPECFDLKHTEFNK